MAHVPLPTAPRYCGSALKEFQCPLPPGSVARHCGSSTTPCLQLVRQWAAQILQFTASVRRASGQCSSCNALPHWPRAMGSASPAMHYHTAWGTRHCNSYNALP